MSERRLQSWVCSVCGYENEFNSKSSENRCACCGASATPEQLHFAEPPLESQYFDLEAEREKYWRSAPLPIATGECGETVGWIFSLDGTLSIFGQGPTLNHCSPWAEYRTMVTRIQIQKGITRIGENAFQGCSVEHLWLPDSIREIGSGAFRDCEFLKILCIPEGIKTIGEGVLTTSEHVHIYYRGTADRWEQLTQTGNVHSKWWAPFHGGKCTVHMNADSFRQASSMPHTRQVYISDGCSFITAGKYENFKELAQVTLPGSMQEIRRNAFAGCTSLYGIALNGGLRKIGQAAFLGCDALGHIVIPGSVRELGNAAFAGCRGLRAVRVAEGVEEIPDYCFYNCGNLESLSLPASLGRIGKKAFHGCPQIKHIEFAGTEAQYRKLLRNCDGSSALEMAQIKCVGAPVAPPPPPSPPPPPPPSPPPPSPPPQHRSVWEWIALLIGWVLTGVSWCMVWGAVTLLNSSDPISLCLLILFLSTSFALGVTASQLCLVKRTALENIMKAKGTVEKFLFKYVSICGKVIRKLFYILAITFLVGPIVMLISGEIPLDQLGMLIIFFGVAVLLVLWTIFCEVANE